MELTMTGYQMTEVGLIPEDWEVNVLDAYWKVIDCKHITADFIEHGVPLASISEVQSNFVDLRNAMQTTVETYERLVEGGRMPKPGDLIFSRNATVGEVAQVAEWHPIFAMGQDVCLLKKKNEHYSSNYLQTIIKSEIIRTQLTNLMVGSTFKRVNIEQIRNFLIPFPSINEQAAIATALSNMDALIGGLELLIAKKRAIKEGAMQVLLTGKVRLEGFEGEWETKRLGDMLKIKHGKDQKQVENPNGEYPIMASGGIIGWATSFLYDKPSVLIGRKGTIDSPKYMETPFWAIDTIFFSEIDSRANAKFLFYYFQLINWYAYNEASGVPSLNTGTIENIEIYVSKSLDEQTAIAQILSDMDAELAILGEKLVKYRKIKDGMMQELLTGKIRLI